MIQSDVEHDFGKQCSLVIEKFPIKEQVLPTNDFESNEDDEEIEESLIVDEADTKPEVKETANSDGWISNRTEIGRVRFQKKDSLKLFEKRDKWNFTVLIKTRCSYVFYCSVINTVNYKSCVLSGF